MFRTNVEKIKTGILCSVIFFPPKNYTVHEVMWKNIVEPAMQQITIWRIHIALWILKAINTHSEYVMLFFTATVWYSVE